MGMVYHLHLYRIYTLQTSHQSNYSYSKDFAKHNSFDEKSVDTVYCIHRFLRIRRQYRRTPT